jgi:Tfp pilus assembly protein PilN
MLRPSLHLSLTDPMLPVQRAAQWALSMLIVVCVGLAVWLWDDADFVVEQARQYEQGTERLEARSRAFVQGAAAAGVILSEARAKTIAHDVAVATRLVQTRAFSWTQFLNDLEETVPSHISIGSIAIDFKEMKSTITGTAVSLKDVTTFVNALETHAAFENVVLAQHHLQDEDKDHQVVRERQSMVSFDMTVTYHAVHQ